MKSKTQVNLFSPSPLFAAYVTEVLNQHYDTVQLSTTALQRGGLDAPPVIFLIDVATKKGEDVLRFLRATLFVPSWSVVLLCDYDDWRDHYWLYTEHPPLFFPFSSQQLRRAVRAVQQSATC
ncbi:MAG: hypothetical protein AAGJ82_03275 [Bacteroidota bacterium]